MSVKIAVCTILLLFAAISPIVAQDSIATPKLTHEILKETQLTDEVSREIYLPISKNYRYFSPFYPTYGHFSPYGISAWPLHEGFNAEVGFSVSGSFGKHRMKGAGFGEHFAAAYAMPFGKDKRWIGAIGIYGNRMDWGTYHNVEAGIAGMIGYSMNDWCNLYAYGTYNFVPGLNNFHQQAYFYQDFYHRNYPFGFYDNLRGRIGAAAEFKIGSAASITVAFEHDFYDTPHTLPSPPTIQKYPNNTTNIHPDNSKNGSRGGNNR